MSEQLSIDELYSVTVAGQADASFLTKQELPSLLKLSSRIKKNKKNRDISEIKIAVLGSYSIQHFVMMLDAYLLGAGINAEIYEGEYNGIKMDVLNADSSFYRFAPKIVLILMDHRDMQSIPSCLETPDTVDRMVKQSADSIRTIWNRIREALPGCQIFQTNLVIPPERFIGNLECGVHSSRSEYYRGINHELTTEHPDGISIVDMDYLASYIGKQLWFDQAAYFLSKSGFSMDALPVVCKEFTRLIASARGKVYKCLVLDLDNTLWDGVVGDDGYDGINLNPHDAVGEAYRFFQGYLLELRKRGVILAVNSKNDEETAKEPFEKNPDMILQLSDIACFMANWNDKVQNIKQIAAMLNIGTDSMVFVDDNPAEREIVRRYLPEVMVIDLPEDPSYYVRAIDESSAFSWIEITKEDLERAGTYSMNAKRQELMESFVDYNEYLKALDMKAEVGEPDGAQMKRFAQLINKSNQFNLRTKRYSEEELSAMKTNPDIRMIYVDLSDKFSEYGIISCIILKKEGGVCFVDTWLMSCRVLKRGVELLAYDAIYKTAVQWGCSAIEGEYLPTKKNGMVSSLYSELGFDENKNGRFILDLKDYHKREFYIQI
jgi:FkbH-like protein